MFRLECKRVLKSPLFWVSLLIGCALAVWHFCNSGLKLSILIEEKITYSLEGKTRGMDYPPNVFNRWLGGDYVNMQPYLYFLILPILAAFPHGASYLSDVKSGYIKGILTRSHRRSYFWSKALAVFLSGGAVAVIPLLLNIFLTATTLPVLKPEVVSGLFPIFVGDRWCELYYSHPWVYIALYLALIFLFSGLFATICLPISRMTDNRFLVLIFPFLFVIFLHALAGFLLWSEISPVYFLRPTQPAPVSPLIMLVEALILFGSVVWFVWRGIREDVF